MAKNTTTTTSTVERYAGFPGLMYSARSRATGTQFNIWKNAEAGKSTAKGIYTVECEDHRQAKVFGSRRDADAAFVAPLTVCAKCKAAASRNGKKAA